MARTKHFNMRQLLDFPIRKKLTVVIILANVLALLVAGTASVFYEISLFKSAALRQASAQAELLGATSATAVAGNDAQEAEQHLAPLSNQEQIVWAAVFNQRRTLVAEYVSDPTNRPSAPVSFQEGHVFEPGYVTVVQEMSMKGRPVGTLMLRSRTEFLERNLEAGLGTVVVAVLVSTLLVLFLSLRVQRDISDPLQNLAQLVGSIGTRSDYSLRAVKRSNDEIGTLIEGVNRMLDQIQIHERELQTSEERFRQVTESIREVFWMTDAVKHQMIYISPSYEEVWHRSCARLYQSPDDWLEAIHPNDRERVQNAVKTKQAEGTYDEEYRIVRPDGTIRWIRDRAFPVFDKTGALYRIAGIAEDITERKGLEREVLEISDREQERLGQDLHDGLCQHLVSIAMTASLLKRRLSGLSNPEARIADRICSQLEEAVAQARGLARGVCALDLADDNLFPALRELASAATREYGIPCELIFPEPISLGDRTVVTSLYRIAREAVYNAAKHARAQRISIEIKGLDDSLSLVVRDDGVGIDNNRKNASGMGLGLMRYRASLMGADFKIENSPDGGTVMTCNLPRNHL